METIQLLGGDGDGIEGWLGKRSGEASEDSAGLRGCDRSLGLAAVRAILCFGDQRDLALVVCPIANSENRYDMLSACNTLAPIA